MAEFEWANTRIYYLIYDSIDLGGPFKTMDRAHIRKTFCEEGSDTYDGSMAMAYSNGFCNSAATPA